MDQHIAETGDCPPVNPLWGIFGLLGQPLTGFVFILKMQ